MVQPVLLSALRDISEPVTIPVVVILQKISGNMTQVAIPGHRRPTSAAWEEKAPPALSSVLRPISARECIIASPTFTLMIFGNMTKAAIPGLRKHLAAVRQDGQQPVSAS